MKNTNFVKYIITLIVYISTSLIINNVIAATNSKPIVCQGEYALCSAAKCIPDPRHNNYAICNCQVYKGPSLGNENCKKRIPFIDKDKLKHIVSTFSFNNDSNSAMLCPAGSPWTNCVDAPCIVDPTDPHKSYCSCPIEHSGVSLTFGGDCDTSTCQNSFWSGALIPDADEFRKILSQAMHINPKVVTKCSSKNL